MPINQIIQRLSSRQLFLIDGIGALASAILLGVVLVGIQDRIGVPTQTLLGLSGMATAFFIYSSVCYWWVRKSLAPFLKAIAICNVVYCLITLGVLVVWMNQLKMLTYVYFISEILIILALVFVELSVANKEIKSAKRQD